MKKLTFRIFFIFLSFNSLNAQEYKNFETAVYVHVEEVQKMADPKWLSSTWELISSQVHIDKIYLETHRDYLIDEKILVNAIKFFKDRGIKVAGGITLTYNEQNLYETFCYTKPEQSARVQEIVEFTASHFDEVILDDFFFTSCKCELCFEAKGNRTWAEYRTEMMTDKAINIIVNPAKAINPNVKVVIKYPNWYDHFQETGFNLKTQPAIFDGIYTGNETRDNVTSNQHLQPYLSYLVFQYFSNTAPGKNGGGWVDTGGMKYYDRYAEQLWLTILSKAPELTLFNYKELMYVLRDSWIPEWSDTETSFNYDEFLPYPEESTLALAAGNALRIIDRYADKLGTPYGIKSYKPYFATGEDFLQNYLGMIGIAMDLVPEFPNDEGMIILTEQAKADPDIVQKIQSRLLSGKDIMITSGLVDALQDRGLREIVNLEYTSRKAIISDFLLDDAVLVGDNEMLIPQIQYSTNDTWEIVSGMDGELGWPLLHMARIADATLYMLTIPENFSDLYNLPTEVLGKIREVAYKGEGFSLNGPSEVSLFAYANNSIVLHNFNDDAVDVALLFNDSKTKLTEVTSGKKLTSKPYSTAESKVLPSSRTVSFDVELPPHSFKIFKYN